MSVGPRVFVTGATGQLGRLVLDALLEMLSPRSIVAGVRDPAGEAAAAITALGVETRLTVYDRPETLDAAFAGIDRLLLISSSENGHRKPQHRNVVDAAARVGVGFVAYTSILRADTSPLALADEHRDTEAALAASGLPHALLRNGWYNEVYTWRLPLALEREALMGAAGEGRISSAARADYAAAAAAVLAGDGHAGRVYELAGDASFSLTELANVVTAASGRPIAYRDMAPDAFRLAVVEAGLPEAVAAILSDTDAGVARGALFETGGALSRLIGRPTTPFQSTITEFLQATAAGREADRR